MKKFLKKMFLALTLVPMSMFCVACGEDPVDPETPPAPPTQAEINAAGHTSLKAAYTKQNKYEGGKTIKDITTNNSNSAIVMEPMTDGGERTEVDLTGTQLEGEVGEVTSKTLTETTIDAATNTGATKVFDYTGDTKGALQSASWVAKEDGTDKYIRYGKELISGEEYSLSVDYVGSDYAKTVLFLDAAPSDESDSAGAPDMLASDIILSSTSFDDMVTKLEASFASEVGIMYNTTTTPNVEFDVSMVQGTDGYTMTVTCSIGGLSGDITGTGMNADLEMDAKTVINFNENGISSVTIETDGMAEVDMTDYAAVLLPPYEGEGEPEYTMVMDMDSTSTITYSQAKTDDLFITATEKAEYDEYDNDIQNTRAFAFCYVVNMDQYDATMSSTSTRFPVVYGSTFDPNGYPIACFGDGITFTWYTDEACTVEYDPTAAVPSYNFNLYAKANVEAGKILVVEKIDKKMGEASMGASTVSIYAIEEDASISLMNQTDFAEMFDGAYTWTARKVNNVAVGDAETVYAVEAGNVYVVVYEIDLMAGM